MANLQIDLEDIEHDLPGALTTLTFHITYNAYPTVDLDKTVLKKKKENLKVIIERL